MGYGAVAAVVVRLEIWNGVDGRRDLHAGIPTCDYDYFALEVRESVGVESHDQNEYGSQSVLV